jgi:Domain of unknown function (DUF1707)
MPLRTRGYGTRQRATDATMRVSDAERAEVADQLAQHYGDGRLDQAELDERLSRAMGAKTHSDLAGITADLPHLDPRPGSRPARASSGYPPAPRSRRPRSRVLPTVLLIVLAVVAWHAVTPFFWAPFWHWPGLWLGSAWWLWIALLIFCWLRFGPRRHRR